MTGDPEFVPNPEGLARTARGWWNLMHGKPSESDRVRFAQWSDADPAHAAAYDRQQYLWKQGELLARTQIGRSRGLPRGSIYDRRPTLAWASTMTIAALLVIGVFVGLPTRLILPPPADQSAYFASPAGQFRTIRLGDGSLVTLDRASRLRVAFAPTERRLWLVAGRARFTVGHDPKRPFIVAASNVVVIARGTVFDVDLAATGARVVLLRGSVEVRRPGYSPLSRMLAAGQEIDVEHSGRFGTARPTPGLATQWLSRMIALDATPLAEAIAELNRHNVVQISVADPKLGGLRMSGAFQLDDPIGFAAAAAVMFGLEVRRVGDALTLTAVSAPSAPSDRMR